MMMKMGFDSYTVILAVVVVFSLFGIVMTVLLYFAAWFEKRPIRALQRADERRGEKQTQPMERIVADALALRFQDIGFFSDGDPGWREGFYDMLLSEDGFTLLLSRGGLAKRFMLITRLPDERMIITTDIAGAQDVSGLHDEEMLPGVPLKVVYQFHVERLLEHLHEAIPFDPATVTEELLKHEHARIAKMVGEGLARYCDDERQTWRHTRKGASQVAASHRTRMNNLGRQMDKAKAAARASAE